MNNVKEQVYEHGSDQVYDDAYEQLYWQFWEQAGKQVRERVWVLIQIPVCRQIELNEQR